MPSLRDQQSDIFQIGTFRLDGQLYGVDILRMREILLPQDIVRVPRAPRIMEGVINLRGQVIPVVSLRARMNLPLRPFDKKTRIINMEISGMTVGFLVDSIEQLHSVRAADIQAPPSTFCAVEEECISGMARIGDAMLVLLDPDRLAVTNELLKSLESRDAPSPRRAPDAAAPCEDLREKS